MKILYLIFAASVSFGIIFILLGLGIFARWNSPSANGAIFINKKKSNQFYLKSGKVIYVPGGNFFKMGTYEIEGADASTFVVLDQSFAKDQQYVYHHNTRLEQADPVSAQIIPPGEQDVNLNRQDDGSGFLKDAKRVYFGSDQITGADPQTFEALWGAYARDNQFLYYSHDIQIPLTGKIETFSADIIYLRMGDEVFYHGHKLNVDADSYEIINDRFSRDKDNFYLYCEKQEGVDPASFRTLNNYFNIDANRAYYFLHPIEGSDPKSFTPLMESFAKDDTYVYYESRRIQAADPATFTLSDAKKKAKIWIWSPLYIDDRTVHFAPTDEVIELARCFRAYKGKVYSPTELLDAVSPDDIRVYDHENIYVQLNQHILYCNQIITGADIDSFEVISEDFSKDRNAVYWQENRLINVSPDSFEYTEDMYGQENSAGDYELVH